jgi:hypothetical protein
MTRLIVVAIVLSFGYLSYAVAANQKKCTHEEAYQAESDTDNFKRWDDIYQSFKRFGHCDTGAISEGYSDAIGRLLADDWKHFDRLSKLCSSNKRFERFVVKHIDATIPANVLQKIVDNARLNCPSRAARLCKTIEAAASVGWEPELK